MSATRIAFIVVCVILSVIICAIGLAIERGRDGKSLSITGLMSRAREKRRKRPVLPKTASAYFTIVLALAAIALLLIFSRR